MTHLWGIDPALICNQHLLGYHKECHQANGSIAKKMNIISYLKKRQIEPKSIKEFHDEVVLEMLKRKTKNGKSWQHSSPLTSADISYMQIWRQNIRIIKNESLWLLLNHKSPKCKCRERIIPYLYTKHEKMIKKLANQWQHHYKCRKDICLDFEGLCSIGNEIFMDCIRAWNWENGSFGTLFYRSLWNGFHDETKIKKPDNDEIDPSFKKFENENNIENQIHFKQLMNRLSPQGQFVIQSALHTPLSLIEQSKIEVGCVRINKKRLQRYLVEKENWTIYSCWKTFDEIKEALAK